MKNRFPPGFDKYEYYRRAVQSPETDVEFLRDTYKKVRGHRPQTLREDFCGTFAISCEWVKLHASHSAHGVDLDPEPVHYGREHYLSKLSPEQQRRMFLHQTTVLDPNLPKVDLIAAMNFSYFIFKTRDVMSSYLANCRATLRREGILIMDCFGGSACQTVNEEETQHRSFSYYWDQTSFNPINNEALFKIHFKPRGRRKIKDVFVYDWRMWSIRELREILAEVGFKKSTVHWEGTNRSGGGNGIFTPTEKGECCEGWIAYIVAEA